MPTVAENGENVSVEETRKQLKWENDDYICCGHILNGMSDSLFDVYQNVESAKELCDALELKYMAKDASSKKFLVSDFNSYKMSDARPVVEQYNELLRIVGQFAQHNMKMDESISVSSIIDKLPPSWKDFRRMLKHKKEELSLVQLGSHLRIEESLRVQEGGKPKNKEAETSSINMMEESGSSKMKNKGKNTLLLTTPMMDLTYNSRAFVGFVTSRVTSNVIVGQQMIRIKHNKILLGKGLRIEAHPLIKRLRPPSPPSSFQTIQEPKTILQTSSRKKPIRIFSFLSFFELSHHKSDHKNTSIISPEDSFISINFEDNRATSWEKGKESSQLKQCKTSWDRQYQHVMLHTKKEIIPQSMPHPLTWRKRIRRLIHVISFKSQSRACHLSAKVKGEDDLSRSCLRLMTSGNITTIKSINSLNGSSRRQGSVDFLCFLLLSCRIKSTRRETNELLAKHQEDKEEPLHKRLMHYED
ncbi:hypothetical protein ISN45_Aa01g030140 [Arabidopsis thaliana x Arabidopsis arenosa]|uniref:Uncharacterized protein n=1 Tax=Arabidopsis thaliana x Arabidopsis arenosa TaxID=1240361 RepID=A0A8T2C4M4_9BRAS|nr:hypothetical protein ISN45_Aa01g030140 [Arabidopsis thaliana x Arabidopsis arenosa]